MKKILTILLLALLPLLAKAQLPSRFSAPMDIRIGRGVEFCVAGYDYYEELGRISLLVTYSYNGILVGAGIDRRDTRETRNGYAAHLRTGYEFGYKRINLQGFLDIEKCFALPQPVKPLIGLGAAIELNIIGPACLFAEFCFQSPIFGNYGYNAYCYYYYQRETTGYACAGVSLRF